MEWFGVPSLFARSPVPAEVGFKDKRDPSNVIIYKDIKLLGKGGYGSVHKVEKVGSKEVFALKIIEPKDSQKVEEEAKLMEELKHPNIPQIDSYFWDEKTFYIVMEFVPGKDLKQYLNERGAIPFPRAIPVIIELLHSISYMHGKKVTHKDLKLRNLLCVLDKDGNLISLKIADFGVAVQLKDYSQTLEGSGGTRCYMAPEYFGNTQKTKSYMVDIFAAGLIIYAIFTKDFNFMKLGNNAWDKYMKKHPSLLHDKIENDGLRTLIDNMLREKTSERWSIRQILESDFVIAVEAIQKQCWAYESKLYTPDGISYLSSMVDKDTKTKDLIYILKVISDSFTSKDVPPVKIIGSYFRDFGDIILNYGLVPRILTLMEQIPSLHEVPLALLVLLGSKYKLRVIAEIFGAGFIEPLLEQFKISTPMTNVILGHICSVPYASRELLKYGLHDILLYFFLENKSEYAEVVFKALHNHQDQFFLKMFLEGKRQPLALDSDLFWLCDNTNELLDDDDLSKLWRGEMAQLAKLSKQGARKERFLFCSCLVRMIFPIQSLYIFAKNNGYNVNQLGIPEASNFSKEELLDFNSKEWDFTVPNTFQEPPVSCALNPIVYNYPEPLILPHIYCTQRPAFTTYKIRSEISSKYFIKDRSLVIEQSEVKNSLLFYYEVRIDFSPSSVSIGFYIPTQGECVKSGVTDYDRQDGEYAYHNQFGHIYFSPDPSSYGRAFGVGDTVGCGITSSGVFYTLNGVFLGYVKKLPPSLLTDSLVFASLTDSLVFASLCCNADSGAQFTFFYEKQSFLFFPSSSLDSSVTWNREAVASLLTADVISDMSSLCNSSKQNPFQIAILMKVLQATNPDLFELCIEYFPNLDNNPQLPYLFQILFDNCSSFNKETA